MTSFSEKIEIVYSQRTGGCLCVGLDVDLAKLPRDYQGIHKSALVFCQDYYRSYPKDLAAAYKPNLAFFESLGAEGLEVLEQLRTSIPPDALLIIDAKRAAYR